MMTGMDSQFIANLISGISAAAAIASAIIARKQAAGSKEARADAEEARRVAQGIRDAVEKSAEAAEKRALQAEKSLKEMEKIAASLQGPEFELTNVISSLFELRNVAMDPVKILEVVNLSQFENQENLKEIIEKEFGSGEMVQVYLNYYGADSNLRLRIEGRDNILCVPIKRNLQLLK